MLHACCVLGFQTREPINSKDYVQNLKVHIQSYVSKNELKTCCVLGLDLFESVPEVPAAPKPDATPSIDLFGTGKE